MDLIQVLIVFADVEVVGQVDVAVIDVGVSLALLGVLGASQIDLVQVLIVFADVEVVGQIDGVVIDVGV